MVFEFFVYTKDTKEIIHIIHICMHLMQQRQISFLAKYGLHASFIDGYLPVSKEGEPFFFKEIG